MSLITVKELLEAQLEQVVAGMSEPLPIAWPNVEFVPPTDAYYVESHLMPATTSAPDIQQQMEQLRGVYQITLCGPQGDGEQRILELAEEIKRGFPATMILRGAGGFTVVANGPCTVWGATESVQGYVCPISFEYEGH